VTPSTASLAPPPPDWDAPLPPAERDALLDAAAHAVARRSLQTPVLFALEMHRPFGFLAGQTLMVFAPLVGPLLGPERLQTLSRLLQTPGAVDGLIARIEATDARDALPDGKA